MFSVFMPHAGAASGIEAEGTLHDGKETVFRTGLAGPVSWTVTRDGTQLETGTGEKDGAFRLTLSAQKHEGALLRAVSQTGEERTLTLHIEAHALVHTLRQEASCAAEGVAEHWRCSICGAFFEDPEGASATDSDQLRTGALGHDMRFCPGTEPQAEAAGTREHWECTRCGGRFWDETGKEAASDEDLFISPAGHAYAASVHEPSCTEPGYTEYICSHCGDSYRDNETGPLGHDLRFVQETGAYHTGAGTRSHYACTRCGALFADGSGGDAVQPSDLVLPAPGHSWETHRTEPSCEEPGTILQVCSVCGEHGQSEEIPANGHDLIHMERKDPAGSEDGWLEHWRCAVCGAVFGDAAADQRLEEKDIVLPMTGGSSASTDDAETPAGALAGFLALTLTAAVFWRVKVRSADPMQHEGS